MLVETESEAARPSGHQRGGSGFIEFALVGAGGAGGALARYVLSAAFGDTHVLVTLTINVTGAFLLGLLVTALAGRHPRVQLLLGTGLLGGFTTYSMLAFQASELVLNGSTVLAVLYGLGTVMLGFAAVLAGVGCGSALRRLVGWSR